MIEGMGGSSSSLPIDFLEIKKTFVSDLSTQLKKSTANDMPEFRAERQESDVFCLSRSVIEEEKPSEVEEDDQDQAG